MGPGSMPVIRILLVDSHTIFLAGLRLLLHSRSKESRWKGLD